MKNHKTMPKGIKLQPTRAQRHGNQGSSRADNTSSNTDYPQWHVSGDSWAPAFPTELTLAISSAVDADTPAQILTLASGMQHAPARNFLVHKLRQQGWQNMSLESIPDDERIEDWIWHFLQADLNLSFFSFELWQSLVQAVQQAENSIVFGRFETALSWFERAQYGWFDPIDQLRVRFGLLGRVWQRVRNATSLFEILLDWFSEFDSQPEEVKDTIRKLWHDEVEDNCYSSLREEVHVHRGGHLPGSLAGFCYTFDYAVARAAAGLDGQHMGDMFAGGRPHIYSRSVAKNIILGVKAYDPNDPTSTFEAVASPCITGNLIVSA